MSDGFVFDEASARRIGTVVREVERSAEREQLVTQLRCGMVPHQIQRFQLIGTWEYDSDGQYAECYRLVRSSGNWVADTTVTYKIYSTIAEAWDAYYNNVSSPSETQEVIAYHRFDEDRWEVIHMNQNHLRIVECLADWALPVSGLFPTVIVQLVDESGTKYGAAFTAEIPVPWNASPLNRQAPELFTGDLCQVDINNFGIAQVSGPVGMSRLGHVDTWHDSGTLPPGFVDCDGAALPVDKKVSRANAPGRTDTSFFWLQYYSGGGADEDALDDTGGRNAREEKKVFDQVGGWSADDGDGTGNTGDTAPGPHSHTIDLKAAEVSAGETADMLDNRPEYYATRFIYRYK